MVLAVHSNASHLSKTKARSQAGGHFYMLNGMDNPRNNGVVLNISTIIKAVMSSAVEAKLGALYIDACKAIVAWNILQEMGHKQPRTPIQCDNSTAIGVMNNKIQPKRTKAMCMRYHWLQDREMQGQFCFYWKPGKQNLADYWTKHHCPAHHTEMKKHILTPTTMITALQASLSRQARAAPAA